MALHLTLKAHERVIIGGAVIRNGPSRIAFQVENDVPVLRETDILRPGDADTPCRRVYLALQLMYVDPARMPEHELLYRKLATDVRVAAPSTGPLLDDIDCEVATGRFYQAIKRARALLNYEEELLAHGV